VTFLKTAFEAMLRKRGGWEQAKRLRRRFEALADVPAPVACDDIAWSPAEEETMTIALREGQRRVTPLQHWYMAFGDHRNASVHASGRDSGPMYEEGTAYDGPLFQTGERVVRDLIRTELTIASGRALVDTTLTRAFVDAARMARERLGAEE
jgi:hypothetical protein